MKKTLFLAASMLLLATASAQIANGRIGNGNINIAGTEWTDVYGIDFNNDGILEFRLSDYESAGLYTNAYISYNWTEGGNNIIADPEVWDYAGILSANDVIDEHGNFAGYGDATFDDLLNAPSVIYVGFRILLSDGVHYGWASANVYPSANNVDVQWTACAYNTVPGAAIAAGQTGGNAIADAAMPAFQACALGQSSLRIEAGDSEVKVYDLGGRLLNTVRGTTTLTMPETGVYLLRAEGTTRKVLVY